MTAPVRYRFSEFVLSRRQRLLYRNGTPVALIPKYLELLSLLLERRRDAVSKQAIFAEVWSDVIVSDGALAQAIRTLRRTLGDDVRDPRFIRTVSRHGYQFIWTDVVEEPDDGHAPQQAAGEPPAHDQLEPLVDRLMAAASGQSEEEARDVAEQLHLLGTAEAVATISARPNHSSAVAILRDARWTVPAPGDVPLLKDPEGWRAIAALVGLRLAAVRTTIARRWSSAAAAGALGGVTAGAIGGLALWLAPGSQAQPESAVALGALGLVAGAVGAGGIASGLIAAEALARSRRGIALTLCGGAAGMAVAAAASIGVTALLRGLFGLSLPLGYSVTEGLILGVAAGGSYAAATALPPGGGMAAPRGVRRLRTAAIVAAACALSGIGLALTGHPMVGGLVHDIARASRNATLELGPLGHWLGEPDFGPITRALLSAFEGAAFGFSLAIGLTSRPGGRSQNSLTNPSSGSDDIG